MLCDTVLPMNKPVISTDEKKIDELLSRGVAEVIVRENLKKRLLSGEQLRIKLGIDPTSPNIHIGRSIPLLKLRDFQELGHQIVLIVGDFTSVIGDTSDKDSERPMLTRLIVEENKKNYLEQVGKILDMETVEFRHNSEWLEKLTYREIGEHADLFSVSDFVAYSRHRRRGSIPPKHSRNSRCAPCSGVMLSECSLHCLAEPPRSTTSSASTCLAPVASH